MKEEYIKLIAERDVMIGELRVSWMKEENLIEKEKLMRKINKQLDERLRLMKLRDGEIN